MVKLSLFVGGTYSFCSLLLNFFYHFTLEESAGGEVDMM